MELREVAGWGGDLDLGGEGSGEEGGLEGEWCVSSILIVTRRDRLRHVVGY
jgi:hypothetical protein